MGRVVMGRAVMGNVFMGNVFRVGDAPPAARLDYWRRVVGAAIRPMDVRLDVTFPSRVVAGRVGAARVTEVVDGAGEARCTPKHLRASATEMYQVYVQGHGQAVAEQNGRRCRLEPGDFSLTDLSRPFHCAHSARQAVCIAFPPALLPLPADDVADVMGVRIPGDRGAAALASSLVRQLPSQLADCDPAGGGRLAAVVLDLLSVAFATRLDRAEAAPAASRRRALLMRIHEYIESGLGSRDLSPPAIAAAHHISLRYLHKLFESREMTVAELIRRRRLERCRRDLLDPAMRDRPVAAIATRWGFRDAAHFSRVFRGAYGVPPTEFRAMGDKDAPSQPPQRGTRRDEAP